MRQDPPVLSMGRAQGQPCEMRRQRDSTQTRLVRPWTRRCHLPADAQERLEREDQDRA